MTILNAVQAYVDAKNTFDSAMAEAQNMRLVLIPQAKNELHLAETSMQVATANLRNAVTAGEVQTAREALATAEQSVKDLIQLKDNLEARVAEFDRRKMRLETDVANASREVWGLKRAELMAQFEIPAAEFELLEKLVAATDGEKDGWGNKVMGDPINEKYGRLLDHERSKLLRDQMLNELIGQLPA